MNFHFNRYLKRKLYEIIFNPWSSFFLCILSKWSRWKKKKSPHAPFCKMLHPINAKTLKRLRRRFDWLVQFFFSVSSSFRISVFILSFCENIFNAFSFLLWVSGEKESNNKEKHSHNWLWGSTAVWEKLSWI